MNEALEAAARLEALGWEIPPSVMAALAGVELFDFATVDSLPLVRPVLMTRVPLRDGFITLPLEFQEEARAAAERRFKRRRAAGSRHRWGRDQDEHTVEKELEAVGAEPAVGCAIGRRWVDTDTPDYDGDVGEGVQVRHTWRPNGRLVLHPEDKDAHAYFLVTHSFPTYRLHGWVWGYEGKLQRYWKAIDRERKRPAFWLDQPLPRPVESWVEPC